MVHLSQEATPKPAGKSWFSPWIHFRHTHLIPLGYEFNMSLWQHKVFPRISACHSRELLHSPCPVSRKNDPRNIRNPLVNQMLFFFGYSVYAELQGIIKKLFTRPKVPSAKYVSVVCIVCQPKVIFTVSWKHFWLHSLYVHSRRKARSQCHQVHVAPRYHNNPSG